jgi:hypothetical protein
LQQAGAKQAPASAQKSALRRRQSSSVAHRATLGDSSSENDEDDERVRPFAQLIGGATSDKLMRRLSTIAPTVTMRASIVSATSSSSTTMTQENVSPQRVRAQSVSHDANDDAVAPRRAGAATDDDDDNERDSGDDSDESTEVLDIDETTLLAELRDRTTRSDDDDESAVDDDTPREPTVDTDALPASRVDGNNDEERNWLHRAPDSGRGTANASSAHDAITSGGEPGASSDRRRVRVNAFVETVRACGSRDDDEHGDDADDENDDSDDAATGADATEAARPTSRRVSLVRAQTTLALLPVPGARTSAALRDSSPPRAAAVTMTSAVVSACDSSCVPILASALEAQSTITAAPPTVSSSSSSSSSSAAWTSSQISARNSVAIAPAPSTFGSATSQTMWEIAQRQRRHRRMPRHSSSSMLAALDLSAATRAPVPMAVTMAMRTMTGGAASEGSGSGGERRCVCVVAKLVDEHVRAVRAITHLGPSRRQAHQPR